MKRLWYYHSSFWLPLLLALVFGTILIMFFVFLQKDPTLATAILAFATVILAIVAVLSIINANEREKRRIERSSQARSLENIRSWVQDIINLIPQVALIGGKGGWSGTELIIWLQTLENEGVAISNVAEHKFSEVKPLAKELVQALTEATETLKAFREDLPPKSSASYEILVNKLSRVSEVVIRIEAKLSL